MGHKGPRDYCNWHVVLLAIIRLCIEMKEDLYIFGHSSKQAELVLHMGVSSILVEWNTLLQSMWKGWRFRGRRRINLEDVNEVVLYGKGRKQRNKLSKPNNNQKKKAMDPVIRFLF